MGEPQTKENNKYDIMYKDFVFFSCGLYAKHRKKDGKLEKFPIFPVEWEKLEKSIPVVKGHNAVAILTGKVSNLTVIDYDNKEFFERDKLLFPEILTHYVKIIRVIIVILNLMIKYHLQQLMA